MKKLGAALAITSLLSLAPAAFAQCQGFLKKGHLRCSKNPHPVVMPSARAQVFSVTQPSAFPGAETSRP
jgi:hypothetical protein